jgi:hypothetical protein
MAKKKRKSSARRGKKTAARRGKSAKRATARKKLSRAKAPAKRPTIATHAEGVTWSRSKLI